MAPPGRGDGVASASVGDGVTGSELTGDAAVGGDTDSGPEGEHAERAMLQTSTATATRRVRVRTSLSSAFPPTGTVCALAWSKSTMMRRGPLRSSIADRSIRAMPAATGPRGLDEGASGNTPLVLRS